MVDSSRVLAQADAILRRLSPEGKRLARRARQRRWRLYLRRLSRSVGAVVLIAFAAALFGLFVAPLGLEGLLLTVAAMLGAVALIIGWPVSGTPTAEALGRTDLASLPLQIEQWLEERHRSLPPPAGRLVDGISLQLEALSPQLATLDPQDPAAHEIRKLICEELPELVDGYTRVPPALRSQEGNGFRAPDQQLIDGLTLVSTELDRMSGQLARGDLHKLATQKRYLELKYREQR